ncbi:hypothetical protein GGR42_001788 [Saonia flava]|uniref:Uncharacterized protein n=1 Tax=Saonia flava TaxID=523696 RepID=A0A846QQM1_9FLAO|nr:hypothetical protein [Saonia flava]
MYTVTNVTKLKIFNIKSYDIDQLADKNDSIILSEITSYKRSFSGRKEAYKLY